jgi:hypothetical protein
VTQARASIKLAQSTDSTERLLGLMSKKVSDLEQQLSELQREKIFPLNPRSLGPSVLTGGPLLAPLFANSMDTGRPIGDLTFAPGTLGATIGPQPPFGYLPPVLNLGIKIPEDESEK